MIRSAFLFAVIILLAVLSGAFWGAHESFMHHWPTVHAKFPNISDWWNPNVSWTFKDKYPWWFPVQLTDGKHLLATLYGLAIAATFWVARGEMIAVGLVKKTWPWAYVLYGGSIAVSYTVGNYLVYDVLFG